MAEHIHKDYPLLAAVRMREAVEVSVGARVALFKQRNQIVVQCGYVRNITTTSVEVTLHVPRLKGISFETAIIERYRHRESSVEEALIEIVPSGRIGAPRRGHHRGI